MLRRLSGSFVACCVALFAGPLFASRVAVITGTVIGEGAHPIAGATVEVVQAGSKSPCATTTAADGTFSLSCAATGRHLVRASFGELRPWEIEDVELGPERSFHLNFILLPADSTPARNTVPAGSNGTYGFWQRRVPNPVVATWQGRPITARMLAIGVGGVAFVLGAVTMIALGRRLGMETRRLSADETGDMILNPNMPAAGERVSPIAVAGARGASATVSYGAAQIAAALTARRYGLVFAALIVAPCLFALFSSALAVAMLVGQELYLLCAMLLVPAGFVLTPIVIGIQAFARREDTRR